MKRIGIFLNGNTERRRKIGNQTKTDQNHDIWSFSWKGRLNNDAILYNCGDLISRHINCYFLQCLFFHEGFSYYG